MHHTTPIAFVESDNCFYHVYVDRHPNNQLIDCFVKQKIPNDYTGTSLETLFPASENLVYQSSFSTNHYHELRVVDAVVELVFGQFMSTPSLEGTGSQFNRDWVFFSPNFCRIVDYIRPETGNTYTTDRPFELERQTYPDLLIVPKSVAQAMIMNDW